jgi:thioredoxin-dependent peroxiredoxin
VQAGDLVEDFELPDEHGTPRRLSDLLAAGPVVLFFYPAAMTYGCTKESCHFRDLRGEIEAAGGHPVGISADPVEKQRQFADRHGFGFPLLSDVDGTVASELGARRRFLGLPNRRVTFVIDTDRRILAVIRSEVSMSSHADRALDVLRARAAA